MFWLADQAAGRHEFSGESRKPSPEEKEGDPSKQGPPTSGAAPVKQAKPAAVIVPDIQGHDGTLYEVRVPSMHGSSHLAACSPACSCTGCSTCPSQWLHA